MNIERVINAEGVTDHTALLPTKNKSLVDFEKLSETERKVLELVYQNLEEATSKPYKYEKTTVKFSYRGEVFTACGVRNLELGWKKNRPDETREQLLPHFKKGDKVAIESVFVEKLQTEPPERFTDGELLRAMENACNNSEEQCDKHFGIGTVATRDAIIESLVDNEFVKRVGEDGFPKKFIPTDLACFLTSVLPDSLKSAKLTDEWEAKLLQVENGTLSPKDFMQEIEVYIHTILNV